MKISYPKKTSGSRLAAKIRKLANKLTPEQRREHFNRGMTMIYGGANFTAQIFAGNGRKPLYSARFRRK